MRLKTTFVMIMFILVSSLISSNIVSADMSEVMENEGVPFTVKPIMPSNQDPNVTNYISIIPQDGKLNQQVEFIMKNNTDKEREISIEVENAYTSPNSIIQYMSEASENSIILDKKHELREYSNNPKRIVKLPGNGERRVSIDLFVDSYDGTLLGGISFEEVAEDDSESTGEINFKIDNLVRFLIGVSVEFNDVEITKDMLKFDEPYIDPMPSYYAIRLPTTFTGAKPKRFDLEYRVLTKEGEELFAHRNEFTFAPKTKTNIPFPWDHDTIKDNESYIIEGSFSYDNEKITFKYGFENTVNKGSEGQPGRDLRAPEIEPSASWSLWTIALSSLTSILLIGLLIFRFSRKYVLLLDDNEDAPELISKKDSLANRLMKSRDYVAKESDNAHIYMKRVGFKGTYYKKRKSQ